MKLLTKTALIAAMAFSANAMAMQSMDDQALSAQTGKDGINLGIGISKVQIGQVFVHDNDGLAANTKFNGASVGGTATAGAIVIGDGATDGVVITANTAAVLPSHNLADVVIDTDAGTAGTGGAFLNVKADVSGLNIKLGQIGVAASNGSTAPASGAKRGIVADSTNAILTGLDLTTGVMGANIQLGATPQGAMVKLNGSMTGGLAISNLGIKDAAGGGTITIGKLLVTDTGAANLTMNADVSVKPEGLAITALSNATDMYVSNVSLSSAAPASIGDIEVSNMRVFSGTNGTTPGAVITVSGH